MVVGGWAAAVRAQPARGGRCTCIRTCDAQQHCRMPQMLAQPLQPACGMAGTGGVNDWGTGSWSSWACSTPNRRQRRRSPLPCNRQSLLRRHRLERHDR